MTVFSRLYRACKPQAAPLVCLSLVLVLAAGVFAFRLIVREDATTLMPERPANLAEQFAVLRDAPFLRGLAVTIGGENLPQAAADLAAGLVGKLRGPEFSFVFSGAGGFSLDTAVLLCRRSPGLMTEEAFAALPGRVGDEAVRAALARDARLLISPKGLALREMLALDPLGICGDTLRSLAPDSGGAGPGRSGLSLSRGQFASADGTYAMVLAEPVSPIGDSLGAKAVMDKVRAAIAELRGGGAEGVTAIVAGAHRHTEENAGIIKGDLFRVLPVSLGLLAALFLIFVRSRQGAAIVLLPAASLAVAAACTGLFQGGLSGIVLGFGSVILGITADYAIHVYFSVRCGTDTGDSLNRVSRPLLLGAATTLAAFAAFFASSIPCVRQMALFASCGLLAALVMALAVLPHCVSPASAVPVFPASAPSRVDGTRRGAGKLAVLWLILAAVLAALLVSVPVDGDIRKLSYISEENARDEARTREIWGGMHGGTLFAVRGESREQALEKNSRLWRDLARAAEKDVSLVAAATGTVGMTSLAPFLPPLSAQAERHAAWENFWRENGPETLERLARHAREQGFAAEAFAPFAAWIAASPAPLGAEDFTAMGLPLPQLLLWEGDGIHAAYTIVPPGEPSRAFLDILDRHGAVYASGDTFRAALNDATRDDLARFGGGALAGVLIMTALVLRSPRRVGLALLPVGAGLLAVLGVFRIFGMSLNIFHAMALPLVMALSVDYGVFMLARLEGVLGRESDRAVLLSGLSTLAGFGSLLLARHPALFSLGLSVCLGLAASLTAALVLLPRLGTISGRGGMHA